MSTNLDPKIAQRLIALVRAMNQRGPNGDPADYIEARQLAPLIPVTDDPDLQAAREIRDSAYANDYGGEGVDWIDRAIIAALRRPRGDEVTA